MAVCGLALLAVQGCGSSSGPNTSASGAGAPRAGAGATAEAPNALSAEAKSAATGDIPDNQIFLTYTSSSPRYAMLYPEGWALKGSGANTTISDKNNIVHVVIASGAAPTTAGVSAELSALKRSTPSLEFTAPSAIQLRSGPAVKATYTTRSAPNPVTGKSVLLMVDRYELSKGNLRATIDLGTPSGVDNVDAYRKMVNSFIWQ
ncbi:MAG TPA: hypothetical protein VH115_00335 [Solirubrobacteraceae bacterium]|nr:hypothetical protein [Solirubrobacteraceae bacterium]